MKKAKKALSKDNAVDFTPNSLKILEKRYLLKDQNGVVAETVEGMFERIAKVVASPDAQYGYEEKSQIEFYNLISFSSHPIYLYFLCQNISSQI